MAKSCPKGQYYCYTDKKCKKIPKGYVIGARGYLRQEPQDDDSKKMVMATVTDTLSQMGVAGMVVEMVTVAMVVMVVVVACLKN